MAVSKRIRFEVLRRDDYTCRYCRSKDNPLTVDHVNPVALGGTDDPTNLVAACKDCNAGKTSSSPESSLVAEVRDDAIRHAELVKQAYDVLVDKMYKRDEYIDQFDAAYGYETPPDYRETIGRWFRMGVPAELVVDAAEQATQSLKSFRAYDRFKYMCGIVWRQVHAVAEAGFAKQSIAGAFMTEESLLNERIESYEIGIVAGRRHAFESMWLSEANPVVAAVDRIHGYHYISERGCSGAEFESADLKGF